MDRLAIVIPCYNEEEMLPISLPRLTEFLSALVSRDKISKDSYLLLVDDGSKDKTWDQLKEWHEKSDMVRALKLARNTGHQNALFSGMLTASKDADMIVSIDADLQDDYTKIEEMVDFYHEGCDIVYGVRSKRDSDSFFKRFTAESYYKLLNRMGVDCVYNHADFRLMSRRAVEQLAKYEAMAEKEIRGGNQLVHYVGQDRRILLAEDHRKQGTDRRMDRHVCY